MGPQPRVQHGNGNQNSTTGWDSSLVNYRTKQTSDQSDLCHLYVTSFPASAQTLALVRRHLLRQQRSFMTLTSPSFYEVRKFHPIHSTHITIDIYLLRFTDDL
jgi:hypothetical protein